MKKIQVLDIKDINPYIRDAGYQGNDSWPYKERKIYDHELLYCTEGKGFILINQVRHPIKNGTLLLIEPNTPTRLTLDKHDPAKLHWIHFDFVYLNDDPHITHYLNTMSTALYDKQLPDHQLIRPHIILTNGYHFPSVLVMKNKNEVANLITNIIRSFTTHDPFRFLDGKVNLLRIIKLVLEQTYLSDSENSDFILHKKHITPRVIHYIHSHYFDKLTLDEIATFIGRSPDYIGKLFKKEMGVSIIAYLNNYRLDKGKALLLQSELNIGEIATIIGFSDRYYFSKYMKTQTGLTPSQWRDQT